LVLSFLCKGLSRDPQRAEQDHRAEQHQNSVFNIALLKSLRLNCYGSIGVSKSCRNGYILDHRVGSAAIRVTSA
jgi:hypothetical protein